MEDQLNNLFLAIQTQLATSLSIGRDVFENPTAKGDTSELSWTTMFENHLPTRYQVSKAFVIDCEGNQSEQIDVIIYDRFYTPILYNSEKQRIIPAESVYAIFEAKQKLNRAHIEYAGKKVASVRRLKRTSSEIHHAGGVYGPKAVFNILSGILCYGSGWNPPFGKPLINCLKRLPSDERMDIGIAVKDGAFEAEYLKGQLDFKKYTRKNALAFFFIRLLARLQQLGTVSAIDYQIYGRNL